MYLYLLIVQRNEKIIKVLTVELESEDDNNNNTTKKRNLDKLQFILRVTYFWSKNYMEYTVSAYYGQKDVIRSKKIGKRNLTSVYHKF